MEKNYICDGTKYMYGKKSYIIMPLPFFDLPETLDVEGYTLLRKSSFHVSLLYVKDLVSIYEVSKSNVVGSADSKNGNIEQSILDCFCRSVKSTDIDFVKFTGEFRLAKDGERVTLVALCEVSGLKELSESFKRDLNIEIPEQPTHVTLYTLQPDIGIGLNSPEAMSSKSVRVEVVGGVGKGLGML
jgi:hypothetical protein